MRGLTIAMGVLATLVVVPGETSAFVLNLNLNRYNVVLQLGDADGDGVLTLEETAGMLNIFGVERTADQLARFDLDNDGNLSEPEIDTAFSLQPASIIKWLDIDGDGRLAVKEIQDHLKTLRIELAPMIVRMVIDTDGDGFVSEEELEELPDRVLKLAMKFPPLLAEGAEETLMIAEKRFERLTRDIIYPMFKKESGKT